MDGGGVSYEDLTEIIEDARLRGVALMAALSIGDALASSLAGINLRMAIARVGKAFEAFGRRPRGAVLEMLNACEKLSRAVEVVVGGEDRERLVRWMKARQLSAFDSFSDPHLFESRAGRPDLGRMSFEGMYIIGSWFSECSLGRSTFDRTMIEATDLSRASLERTSWRAASLIGCNLSGAVLVDATLDHTVFIECDLRGADLGRVNSPMASSMGTCFIGCDLRETNWDGRLLQGAIFDDCRCYGIHGVPSVERLEIERPDLSPAGDATQIGRARDLLALWSR